MSKSRVCVSKTINLAKQKTPAKTTLLVYNKKPGTKSQPNLCKGTAKAPIQVPPAKKIRVCTGAELKKMCARPPCVCEKEKKNPVLSIFQAMKFGAKMLFASSMVYYTWDAGLWSDSEATEAFYTNMCHWFSGDTVKPEKKISEACEAELDMREGIPPDEDKCTDPPINREKIGYRIRETWNKGVTTVFSFIVWFPYNVIDWWNAKRACTPIKK